MERRNKTAYQQSNVEGKNRLKLRLQHFNGGEPGGEGGQGTQGDLTPTPNNEPTPAGGGEPNEPEKTFTQEDVNNIAAKEAKKAQEKLLKQLGIDNFDNAKEGLKQFKEWQESQKTEQQRQEELLDGLSKEKETLSTENASLKAQLSALKQGVLGESVEDVVALAERLVNDDVTIDEAIKQVVEKYPHFAQNQKQDEGGDEPPKPSFTHGDHGKQKPSEADAWLQAFKN